MKRASRATIERTVSIDVEFEVGNEVKVQIYYDYAYDDEPDDTVAERSTKAHLIVKVDSTEEARAVLNELEAAIDEAREALEDEGGTT